MIKKFKQYNKNTKLICLDNTRILLNDDFDNYLCYL